MARAKKANKTTHFYGGRRFINHKDLCDVLYPLGDDGEPNTERASYYPCGRSGFHLTIGWAYHIEATDTGVRNPTFKDRNEDIPELAEDVVTEWSFQDQSAYRANQDIASRKKVTKERKEQWRTMLEPLRSQYRQMSAPQRRAAEQLIIEWLRG